MLRYTDLKFFSKEGFNLNLDRIPNSVVEIHNSNGGFGGIFQTLVNPGGYLEGIIILDGGTGYDPNETYLIVKDKNGVTESILNNNITFDIAGKITDIDVDSSPISNIGGFTFPSLNWTGNLFFREPISKGLIENEHLFIIEKFQGVHTFPKGDENESIELELEVSNQYDDKAIFMFNILNPNNLLPQIERTQIQTISTSTNSNIEPKCMQFNIAMEGIDEGVFERTLGIWYKIGKDKWKIGEVVLHGEVIGEDVRLNTILENIGYQINQEQEFIFRNSDINEDFVNIKLLNEKRKEYILEHSNISPYLGSYKAFFNVLNWLGYEDLKVREYWKNINPKDEDFEQEIPLDIDRKNMGGNIPVPSSVWKKTSKFSLVYQINKETGFVDKWDLPITEDVFMFTIEEVLIKLFALKKYLKEKFLPLNARIYEIMGEGIYFEKIRINSWNNADVISNIDYTRDIDFNANKNIVTISDLRYE